MGGEKCIESGEDVLVSGSPPHGRGKDVPFIGTLAVPGITPAWAGKRRSLRTSGSTSGDHPRMGGEKYCAPFLYAPESGSPPHGRGKDLQKRGFKRRMGITPAWAGKRKYARCYSWLQGDHPRMGGEKCVPWLEMLTMAGSPPHGRGKVFSMMHTSTSTRITPAWAGKSAACARMPWNCGDHPRMGGEKISFFFTGCSPIGSPPHGRGKVAVVDVRGVFLGITPAWAGKSKQGTMRYKRGQDHPRMGGEKRNLK